MPLTPRLRPTGHLVAEDHPEAAPLGPGVEARLQHAFEAGVGPGLLHLGASETTTELPPPWAWLRRLGTTFLAAACRRSELADVWSSLDLDLPEDPTRWVDEAPPFPGREYVVPATLSALWSALQAAFRAEGHRFDGSVHAWLAEHAPAWHAVGRVCLHLAENRRDPDLPFAFLATFTPRVGPGGRPQHVPLAHALRTAHSDPTELDALLAPLRRGASGCPLLARLLHDGSVFRPQKWSAGQAAEFLRSVPGLEAAGLVVRVPHWWATGRTRRPRVQVTLGPREGDALGADALLRFRVEIALDGAPLTPQERARLLAATEGLAPLRGQWVEVDAATLTQVLDHWETAEAATRGTGLSLIEGMRLLAGMPAPGPLAPHTPEVPAWSEVTAGPALAGLFDRLRAPALAEAALPGLRATLRGYQQHGVAWLHTLTQLGLGACLADDMGLGKTLQVLALLLHTRRPERPPSLVVVPTSLLPNWQAEAARFTPTLQLQVAHASAGRAAAVPDVDATGRPWGGADLVLTTYGMLLRDTRLTAHPWDLVVYDEAQALKNPGTRRARAARRLRARATVMLTGTPIENRVGDLWALFDLLNPGLLGSASAFRDFVGRLGDDYAPLRRLIGPYLLRRLKSDPRIAPELPEKTEVTVWCGLSPRQAVVYEQVVAQLAAALEAPTRDIRRRGAVLRALTLLKQVCDHPHLVAEDVDTDRIHPDDSGKLTALARLATTLAERQDKVLVFTQYRRMMAPISDVLTRAFGRPGLTLHGGTPVAERARRVARFQAENGPPHFVLSLRAAGTGLNLTAANHVVHFDRWWNPAVENQATDRAHRIGQDRAVLVHRFVCRGTVEERIDALIAQKAALADEVVGGPAEGPALTELDDAALLQLVQLDLRAARAALES